ncbi:uncharacterized protein LOC143296051 isoform X2 [Babylonia areolata]|uniref:uncharacterized protein LOC143296051 isoform X2 n=1 Tax=Babylonia areolata TaxID=304850 RepID=UPI003FD57963
MFVNGCIGWVPSALGGYWAALAPPGQSDSPAVVGPPGLAPKGKAAPAGVQAYELLNLLHRQAQNSTLEVATSRGYPTLPHPQSYGYVLSYTHAHRPFSPPASASGSGLAQLQKLCSSDSSTFKALEESRRHGGSSPAAERSEPKLKFGISRILDEDFGKSKHEKQEKENNFRLSSVPEASRHFPLCPCHSPTCTAPSAFHTAALSAVHALQPPQYPPPSGDGLPGPYSVLNTDTGSGGHAKRKRSWSRAVFSNLQRKGLERRFAVQKYVTKPDRRQLAAMLGLTDAQVKVWFQNRRMKWRHAQQRAKAQGQGQTGDPDLGEDKDTATGDSEHAQDKKKEERPAAVADAATGEKEPPPPLPLPRLAPSNSVTMETCTSPHPEVGPSVEDCDMAAVDLSTGDVLQGAEVRLQYDPQDSVSDPCSDSDSESIDV